METNNSHTVRHSRLGSLQFIAQQPLQVSLDKNLSVISSERQAHGFVILFDMTRPETLQSVSAQWYELIHQQSPLTDPPVLIVGNKHDLVIGTDERRPVTQEDIDDIE